MKKNFKFIVAAIAAIAMIGCAKDGGEKIATPKNGVETVAQFRITFPTSGTRAFDDSATASESKINDAVVFLFDDATKTLESKTNMTVGTGPDLGTATATVTTYTGKHYVYVLVNQPASLNLGDLVVADPDTPVAGTSMAAFLAKVINATPTLPTEANKFMMTAYAEPTFIAPTIDVPNPTQNKVNMGLGRAVAKVNMDADVESIPDNMLKIEPLKYKVMNNPIKFRAFQQYSMTLNGLVIDNVGTIVNEIAFDGTDRTKYFRLPDDVPATNYVATASAAPAGIYVPENWNTNPAPHTHNATSLIVQGKVYWDAGMEIRRANGTATTVGSGDYTAGATFYRVWDKQTNKWLPQIFCGKPGGDDDSKAMLIGAAGQAPGTVCKISEMKITMEAPADDYEFFIAEYTDANAYWRLPLYNKQPDVMKSVVARNDYFWVTIKTIAELGASSDSDNPDDDGVLPEETEPLDKTQVDITATVEVLKWNGVEQEGHI